MLKKVVILVLFCSMLAGCGADVDFEKCTEISCDNDGLDCEEQDGAYSIDDEQVAFGGFIEDQGLWAGDLDVTAEYYYKKPDCNNNCYTKVATESDEFDLSSPTCLVSKKKITEGSDSLRALSEDYGGPVGEWKLEVDTNKGNDKVEFSIECEEDDDCPSGKSCEGGDCSEAEEEQEEDSGGDEKRNRGSGHADDEIQCEPGETKSRECAGGNRCQYKTCTSDGEWEEGWGPCKENPQEEVCDGIDNDCDGKVDEGRVCAPTLEPIPAQYIDEDSGLHEQLVNLYDYASDPDDSLNELQFSIYSQTNPSIVECSVDNKYIQCETKEDKSGSSKITVGVSDGDNEDTRSFKVKVKNTQHNVRFSVANESDDPVGDARVKLGTSSVYTNTAGQAVFEDVESGRYNYNVSLSNYADSSGVAYVNDEENIDVSLQALPCEEGTTVEVECGLTDVGKCRNGTRNRTCQDGYTWEYTSECLGAVYPDETENCSNGIDDDCDGDTDCNDSACKCDKYYADSDDDGYGVKSQSAEAISASVLQGSYANKSGDCNNSNGSIHPERTELCNDVDMNCNGLIYEDACGECIPGKTQNETCGNSTVGQCEYGSRNRTCLENETGKGEWSEWSNCKDYVSPKTEFCDGLDNDCDGKIDEKCKTNELQKCINKEDKCSFNINRTKIYLEGKKLEVGGNVDIDGNKVKKTDYAKINDTVLLNATDIHVVDDKFEYDAEKTNQLGENNETSPINDAPELTNTSFTNTTNSKTYSDGELEKVNGTSDVNNNQVEFNGVRINLDEDEEFLMEKNSYDKLNITVDKEVTVDDGHLSTAYIEIAPGSRYNYVGNMYDKFSLFIPADASVYKLYLRTLPSESYSVKDCSQCGLIDFVENNATLKGNYEFEKPDPQLPVYTNVIESQGDFYFSLDSGNITDLSPSNFDIYSGAFQVSYGFRNGYRFIDSSKPYVIENTIPGINITNKTLLKNKTFIMYSEEAGGFKKQWDNSPMR